MKREHMTVVIVGHVDHGKSTVIGRLLCDTGSLPQGKLEQVKATCERNAKPFEYAFLLDSLKDEQRQGITIDAARCFFKSKKRDYIILDAPGHIEFLKNMITGASRAEAAILVIDAKEGIQENTKRHGMVVSMLGVKSIIVLVNKMDLVGFSQDVFKTLTDEFTKFLKALGLAPINFIPISAFHGDNLIKSSSRMPWYQGKSFLDELDGLSVKKENEQLPFRFPVQDIYKFTENNDERRIIAGTVETGTIKTGDTIAFSPSGKESRIRTIEEFNAPARHQATSGESIGFTLMDELYLRPGEIMSLKKEALPQTAAQFKANIFWVGQAPFVKDKTYKLKIATAQSPVRLVDIIRIMDAQDLSISIRQESINRHDVASVILEVSRPIAYDLAQDIETLSRFVIVDHFEISGGGIIIETQGPNPSTLEQHVKRREKQWIQGLIHPTQRRAAYKHRGRFIVITGHDPEKNRAIAQLLEKRLFENGRKAYYLNTANLSSGFGTEAVDILDRRDEEIRLLGELGRVLTDAGEILITDLHQYDSHDIKKLKTFVYPFEVLVVGIGTAPDEVRIKLSDTPGAEDAITKICRVLQEDEIIVDYNL